MYSYQTCVLCVCNHGKNLNLLLRIIPSVVVVALPIMTLPILSKGLSYCVDIVVSVILSSSFILLLDAVCFN